jgi:hypothetical protein
MPRGAPQRIHCWFQPPQSVAMKPTPPHPVEGVPGTFSPPPPSGPEKSGPQWMCFCTPNPRTNKRQANASINFRPRVPVLSSAPTASKGFTSPPQRPRVLGGPSTASPLRESISLLSGLARSSYRARPARSRTTRPLRPAYTGRSIQGAHPDDSDAGRHKAKEVLSMARTSEIGLGKTGAHPVDRERYSGQHCRDASLAFAFAAAPVISATESGPPSSSISWGTGRGQQQLRL